MNGICYSFKTTLMVSARIPIVCTCVCVKPLIYNRLQYVFISFGGIFNIYAVVSISFQQWTDAYLSRSLSFFPSIFLSISFFFLSLSFFILHVYRSISAVLLKPWCMQQKSIYIRTAIRLMYEQLPTLADDATAHLRFPWRPDEASWLCRMWLTTTLSRNQFFIEEKQKAQLSSVGRLQRQRLFRLLSTWIVE